MEERCGTQPAVHQRGTRAIKLLNGLSHIKGIIRIPGRKTKDDRDLDRNPYSSRLSTAQLTKPFMSQPILGHLDQGSNFSQHDGDVLKFLTCAERFPSREENGMQKMSPSIHHNLPPRTAIENKNPDPQLPRSPSPPPMPRHFSGVTNPIQDGSRRNRDLPALVVNPLNVQEVVSTTRVYSVTSTPSLSHKAQPASNHPTTTGDEERPGTANSVQTSNSSATLKSGTLLNGERSLSQLQLTKQTSDLTVSSPQPGSMSTNISSTFTHAVTPSLSSRPLPPTPVRAAASPLASSAFDPSTTNKTSPSNSTTSTFMAKGMSPSTNIRKPLPSPGITSANLAKDKLPKLSLGTLNHRLSFNLKTPTVTEAGLARLSPTIITRPPPLPLLNLPTLTPRSESLTESSTVFNFNRGRMRNGKLGEGVNVRSREDRERSLRKSLKSMPALPRKGSGWGVSGHEEVEDYEDESVDDDDDDDDDYDGDSSRNDRSSRSGLLAPDIVADSRRSSFASSRSSLTSLDQGDNLLPPSLSGRGRPYGEEDEEIGTYSSGDSSYHSAHSNAYPSPRPEFAASSSVPRIKYPTPPRGYGQGRGHAAASPLAAAAPAQQVSGIQNRSLSHAGFSNLASIDSQSGLPEVDAARINITSSSSSTSSPTIIDVKGKGKARDRSASSFSSASGSVVTGGTTPTAASHTNQAVVGAFDPYSYHADDSSKTPIATTVRNPFSFRESEFNGMNAHAQSHKRLGKLNSRGSLTAIPNEVEPSPTGTVRQQYQSHVSGTVGGENARIREEGGGEHISEQNASTEGSQPSSPALPRHMHPHSSPSSSSSPFNSSSQNRSTLLSRHGTYHSSTRIPLTGSPASSSGLQTPKAGFSGMKHSVDHFPTVTTRRSTNLLSVGPGGGDGTGFRRPKMYQRASQSMIDIHTLETKERRRKLEEEARADEEREIIKLKQKKKREGKIKTTKDEKMKSKEEEKSRDEEEKIKEDGDTAAEAREREDRLGDPVKSPLASTRVNTSASPTAEGPPGLTKRLSHLRRRRSMPMFDASTEPPPYPSFTLLHTSPASRYTVVPREDEGQERLPPYSNHISLRAIMPRKLEFSSPGVLAKDRKWRRVMCVLEGTALKVYKAPRGHAGVGVFGEWWEKQVGAGDVSLQPSHSEGVSNIQIETREARRAAEERRELERQIQRIIKMEGGEDVVGNAYGRVEEEVVVVEPPRTENNTPPKRPLKTQRSRSRLKQFLKPGKHNRSKSDVNQSERTTHSPSPRPSLNIPRNSGTSTPVSGGSLSPFPASGSSMRAQTPMSSSSQSITESNSASGHTTTPTSATAQSTFSRQLPSAGLATKCLFTNKEKGFLPDPDPADLVKVYSLQNAESGIGNDYLKRRNVIRLRLEGEQFLLQARDVTGVVEWIEALQAATNISLDLDERPMPRGPLFPRRRRRRRAPGNSGTGINGGANGSGTNVTSIANMPLPVATV